MANAYVGNVALVLRDGFIEVVRDDQAPEGSTIYNAKNGAEIAQAAIGHAKELKVLIQAFAPNAEPAKQGPKNWQKWYKPETLEKLAENPVVLKAKTRPLPYLAFLSGNAPERASKMIGLGPIAAKPAKPKAL